MTQNLSVVVDERPDEPVSVGATPRADAKARRWVDDFDTPPAAVRVERRGSRTLA